MQHNAQCNLFPADADFGIVNEYEDDTDMNLPGETKDIKANHSLSDEQIEWFKAGSALNSI